MTRWMKWAAVAVGLVAVPAMALSVLPAKQVTKTEAKKTTPVSHVTPVKKTTTVSKPVTKSAVKPVAKNISPRPASVRLGKNAAPVKTVSHTLSKTSTKAKPMTTAKAPIRPTTLKSGPGKLPTPKSTLPKAMAHTHTTM